MGLLVVSDICEAHMCECCCLEARAALMRRIEARHISALLLPEPVHSLLGVHTVDFICAVYTVCVRADGSIHNTNMPRNVSTHSVCGTFQQCCLCVKKQAEQRFSLKRMTTP